MDISVIIPLYNEEESLPELHAWIQRVMNANGFTYEIIFVNDGSKDRSWDVIEDLHHKDAEHVRSIVALMLLREMLSLRWMPICRILLTRYQSFIV